MTSENVTDTASCPPGQRIRFCEHTIDQLVSLYTHMEGIRWKFVAGFGVLVGGSVAGLTQATSYPIKVLFSFFSMVISVAALICLSRVYGVMVTLWNRIGICQSEILGVLRTTERRTQASTSLETLCLFRFENARSWRTYWLTVTHASSLVFSGILAGMTVYLTSVLLPHRIDNMHAIVVGAVTFLIGDYGHFRLARLNLRDLGGSCHPSGRENTGWSLSRVQHEANKRDEGELEQGPQNRQGNSGVS